jgi:hypothetical protein
MFGNLILKITKFETFKYLQVRYNQILPLKSGNTIVIRDFYDE